MPPRDKKLSPAAMTDVQRLFGEDHPPDGSSEPKHDAGHAERVKALAEADDAAFEAELRSRIRAVILDDGPPAVPPEGHVPDTAEAVPEHHDTAVALGPEGPDWIDLRGTDASMMIQWWEPLRSPPKPELVGAYAVLMVATLIGSRMPGGWVRTDDLFAVMPRTVVDESLRRLRYTGFLYFNADGRFRVVGTPITSTTTKEHAA